MSRPIGPGDPLLADVARKHLARNGVPDEQRSADRSRCHELLVGLLGEDIAPDGIVTSPLGVAWTEVFEVVTPTPVDPRRLAGYGWIPLDRLHHPWRRRPVTPRSWAAVENGRVLAGVRFDTAPRDPVQSVLDRCRQRSEVRLREVLELRELRRREHPFPVDSFALRTAAQVESGLGGRLLAPWATGSSAVAPAPLPHRTRGAVVSVSGVDGAGKSTVLAALAEDLERAGVPVSTVWVRPGMGLGRLTSLAAWAKRVLHEDPRPGLRAMAGPRSLPPASRRGAVGWVWALLVVGSFLAGVWRQHRAARGVVLYDRHLLDALATLDFAYEGVDLRLHRALVRALLPRADVRAYLALPPAVAVARKPDDLLGDRAVRTQLRSYERWLDRLPPTALLDATAIPADIAREVLLRATTGAGEGNRTPTVSLGS